MCEDRPQDASATFDLQPAIAAIAGADNLIEIAGLPPDRSLFDAGDSNGLFDGDVPCGVTIKGEGSLLVQGSVVGVDGNLCRIEMKDSVVITGNVHHAQISSRNIYIGGEARHTFLAASGDIKIGADLKFSRLVVRDYEVYKNKIEELRHKLSQTAEERLTFDRQVHQEERRMDKACHATHIPLNFNVGRIIRHQNDRVQIDLSSFYESIVKQPVDKLELALLEFFAKGIIGVLARSNRKYIVDNPAREKVFLQLLKNLRELFLATAKRDRLVQQITLDEEEIDRLVENLHQPESVLYIQGALLPEIEVEFPLPRVNRQETGEISFVHQGASLRVREGPDADHRELLLHDIGGERSTRQLNNSDLQNLSLHLREGQVVWRPLSTGDDSIAS